MYRFFPAAVLSVFFLSLGAQAAPITSFSGASALNTNVPNANTVQLPNLFISNVFNPSGGNFGMPGGAADFKNGTVTYNTTAQPPNLAAATSSSGTLDFKVINPFTTPNSGTAIVNGVVSFAFNSPQAVTGPGSPTVFGSFSGPFDELMLLSNTTGLDFGAIGSKFHFQASAPGVLYNSATGQFSAPAGTASASFVASVDPTASAVPEPTSAIVFGLLAAGGAFFGWRRRVAA